MIFRTQNDSLHPLPYALAPTSYYQLQSHATESHRIITSVTTPLEKEKTINKA
jgi:hypothetical protein